MHIKLLRGVFTPTSTLGKLFIDDEFFAYTLEDTNRDLNGDCAKKVQDQTCIDPGTYKVIVDHSTRFDKDLPRILNVPCFTGVRIHGGNTAKDTEGCILIGAETDNIGKIWNCAGKVAEVTKRIQVAGAATIEISKAVVV
jgi:hypothetical protein